MKIAMISAMDKPAPSIEFYGKDIPDGEHKVGEVETLTLKMKCVEIEESIEDEKITKCIKFELDKEDKKTDNEETKLKKLLQKSNSMRGE